jgi:hypothetical protein
MLMSALKTIFFSVLIFLYTSVSATTWDEPWQDKVIKEAEVLVFAKIKTTDVEKGVTIDVVKTLAGKEIKGEITITDFYLLDLCSTSGGHGPEFHFPKGTEDYYFFLKKNEKGEYCIATPTTGFDYIKDSKVYANYRHSYHQTITTVDVYEKTMTAIFNNYHDQPYDTSFVRSYVLQYLSLKPAGFSETEINTFFAQHVALECIYHLRLTGFYDNIIPFLNDNSNFHNQISAARALMAYDSEDCKKQLLKTISDPKANDFPKVMCIWTLASFKPKELKKELTKLKASASEEENGFGGNIMDPRVCTSVPTVKDALEQLIVAL